MSIYKIEELHELILKIGLVPIKTSFYEIKNQVVVSFENANAFLDFACQWGERFVFYSYDYYPIDNYIISDELFDDYPDEVIREIKKYNASIRKIDFETPYGYNMFVLQNGVMISFRDFDDWLSERGIKEADVQLEEFIAKYDRTISRAIIKKRQKVRSKQEELREVIFGDPEFKNKKNQELRYWYLMELLDKDEYQKYAATLEPFGIADRGNAKIFMDETWRLYKERMNEK